MSATKRTASMRVDSFSSPAAGEIDEHLLLTISDVDIATMMDDKVFFRTIQRDLRKHGAITNEVLKQYLPLYIVEHKRRSLKQQGFSRKNVAIPQLSSAPSGWTKNNEHNRAASKRNTSNKNSWSSIANSRKN